MTREEFDRLMAERTGLTPDEVHRAFDRMADEFRRDSEGKPDGAEVGSVLAPVASHAAIGFKAVIAPALNARMAALGLARWRSQSFFRKPGDE